MQASQQQFLSLLCVSVLKIYKEPTMKFEEYQSEASQTALYPNRL